MADEKKLPVLWAVADSCNDLAFLPNHKGHALINLPKAEALLPPAAPCRLEPYIPARAVRELRDRVLGWNEKGVLLMNKSQEFEDGYNYGQEKAWTAIVYQLNNLLAKIEAQ